MFLTTPAPPRFYVEGEEIFSGKLEVFPFVTNVPAKRNSVNKVVGTLETKPILSVNEQVLDLS